jgi:hypothetical protein
MGTILERMNPNIKTGIAIARPANGPAIPMSNRLRRSMTGEFILMKAPKVPIITGGGAGIKYGSVTRTPYLFAVR